MKSFALNQRLRLLMLVLCAVLFNACREEFPLCPAQTKDKNPPVGNQPPDQQGEASQDPFIIFDLPSGWQFDPQNHLKALWPHPSKDHKAPQVLLEFYTLEEAPEASANNVQGSGGAGGQKTDNVPQLLNAKDKALKDYQYKLAQCLSSPPCAKQSEANQPQYQEVVVGENGENRIYASESQDIYWNEPSWTSVFTFEKGGKVITFLLQDRVEYYHDLLNTLVQSFKTNIDVKGYQPLEAGLYPTFTFDQIPLGNFENFQQWPVDDLTIIQPFNTSVDNATTFAGSKVYGHTGVDLQLVVKDGQPENIYAIYPGLVILSQQASYNAHWGDAMVLATRLSANSEQILTQHYYHLTYSNQDGHYQTSRRFNASSGAQSGDVLAQQGSSGTWTPHLHVGLHLWPNIQALQQALQNNALGLYGPDYVFDSEEKMAEFLNPACGWQSSEDCLGW